ncbi:basic salivary proline-rich protein 1-like [Sceloporus undulatus]|uniref:basic salivary proline-rich protein 1-like n=1 Tax=Sceloporus undulatus TaxID=8520 RepID=UPI001C4D901F|nr:basic salivary proline-rich protein 1-like [Sceloporus undulatus]
MLPGGGGDSEGPSVRSPRRKRPPPPRRRAPTSPGRVARGQGFCGAPFPATPPRPPRPGSHARRLLASPQNRGCRQGPKTPQGPSATLLSLPSQEAAPLRSRQKNPPPGSRQRGEGGRSRRTAAPVRSSPHPPSSPPGLSPDPASSSGGSSCPLPRRSVPDGQRGPPETPGGGGQERTGGVPPPPPPGSSDRSRPSWAPPLSPSGPPSGGQGTLEDPLPFVSLLLFSSAPRKPGGRPGGGGGEAGSARQGARASPTCQEGPAALGAHNPGTPTAPPPAFSHLTAPADGERGGEATPPPFTPSSLPTGKPVGPVFFWV